MKNHRLYGNYWQRLLAVVVIMILAVVVTPVIMTYYVLIALFQSVYLLLKFCDSLIRENL